MSQPSQPGVSQHGDRSLYTVFTIYAISRRTQKVLYIVRNITNGMLMFGRRSALVQSLVHHAHSEMLGRASGAAERTPSLWVWPFEGI